MNFQIITEAPSWLLIVCLMAGFLYSWFLYRKDKLFEDISVWLVYTMAVLRFLVISMLSILLLSPLIKTTFREIEKPVLVLLQDNSESVVRIRDSVNFKNTYPPAFNSLIAELQNDYDLRVFSVGDNFNEGVKFDFRGKESDLSGAVDEVKARFGGSNLGAVILASDGIYNKGSNPLYAYPALKVPVYTIGLGDTTVLKDVLVSKVKHSKTVFFGNTFPVEVTVDARKCAGEMVTMDVLRNSKVLFTRQIQLATNRYNTVIPVFLEADQKGINHYFVKLSGLDNEINYDNNTRDFFVDVTENKIKILLLANAPHPDLSAIKNIVEQIPNYDLQIVRADDFKGNLSGYNLVIMHQLPSVSRQMVAVTDELKQREIPVFYILGAQTGVTSFNNLLTGIKITGNNGTTGEVLPNPVRDFALFNLDEEIMRRLASFPPLISPFGNYEATAGINVLLNQKIGSVNTGMPLMLFNVDGNRKDAVLSGEGFWKWRLHEFSETGNTEASVAFLIKTIQYLASREQKLPFRLLFKNSYEENEPVIFDAEVRNDAGELINENEVNISLVNDQGVSFPFTFSRTEKAYTLNAGYLPVGVYNFKASCKVGEKKHTQSGTFVINALQAERTETIADHELLKNVSDKTGGKFYQTTGLEQLKQDIINRNDIKPVSYTQKKLSDVINLKWIFTLIILLLSLEWFLRKHNGSY